MPPKITAPHDYQAKVIKEAFEHWQHGYKNICLVAPTGAGKTVVKAFAAKRFLQENPDKMVVIFAHRDVLLNQISCAAASIGLPHRMICARKTEVSIGNTHIEEHPAIRRAPQQPTRNHGERMGQPTPRHH